MKLHLIDHQCDDPEKFFGTQILDAALYEHFNVALRRVYRRSSMRGAKRIREKVSALKSIIDRLKRKGRDDALTVQASKKAKQTQILEAAGGLLSNDGCRLTWTSFKG